MAEPPCTHALSNFYANDKSTMHLKNAITCINRMKSHDSLSLETRSHIQLAPVELEDSTKYVKEIEAENAKLKGILYQICDVATSYFSKP